MKVNKHVHEYLGASWHSSIRNVKIANIGLSLVAQYVVIVGAVITRKSNQKDSGWKSYLQLEIYLRYLTICGTTN